MRYSRQRNLVLGIVKSSRTHPTAEEIYSVAVRTIPSIGIATVYRNLRMLTENGDIRRILGADGVERYDGNIKRHYHFKCTECGRLFDLTAASEDALEKMDDVIRSTFKLDSDDIIINRTLLEGVCSECREKPADAE